MLDAWRQPGKRVTAQWRIDAKARTIESRGPSEPVEWSGVAVQCNPLQNAWIRVQASRSASVEVA